jgi:tetratricopeptide (TPR) repeat protein
MVLVMLVVPAPALAQTPASEAATRAIEHGDSLRRAFRTQEAIAVYRAGLAETPDDATLLWKTARALANLSAETPDAGDDVALLTDSIELARRAVRVAPQLARAHTALAASLGLYARHLGHTHRARKAREVIAIAREVHAESQRAIELDPNDFGPYVILGMWHRELTTMHPIAKMVARTFLGGYPEVSLEQSERHLKRAVRLAPEDVTARLELARTYLAMDREEEARGELRRVLALPAQEKLDLVEQRKARELLERIG